MRPKRIILVRHGESEGQRDPSLYSKIPDHRISLTDLGQEQARKAGNKVFEIIKSQSSFDVFNDQDINEESLITYCSPYKRSVLTFEEMNAGANDLLRQGRDGVTRKVYEDPRLREQEWGNFRTAEETAIVQKERYSYGTFYYRFPHGESGADVYDRVSAFLETIHRDFEKDDYPQNVLIVSHGMTIRLFLMRWFHISVPEFESWENPSNCQTFCMDLQFGGKYSMPYMKKKN